MIFALFTLISVTHCARIEGEPGWFPLCLQKELNKESTLLG